MTIIASNFWSISLKLYPLLENTLVCDIVFDKIQIFVICEGKMLSTGESLLLPKREIKFSASQVYSYSGTTTTTCGDDELFSHHAMQKRREIFELFAHKLLLIQWPWKICMKGKWLNTWAWFIGNDSCDDVFMYTQKMKH